MTSNAQNLKANWSYPTQIRFGAGRIAELPRALAALGIDKPLLVTDPGLAEMPMVRDALALCEDAGRSAVLFSSIKPNPTGSNLDDGLAAYRESERDGVIVFGSEASAAP